MKKTALALLASAAATVAVSAPAQAAHIVTIPLEEEDGTSTGEFVGTVRTAGDFTRTFEFTLPEAGITAATITTIAVTMAGNIDFTSVTLNGVEFNLTPNGFVEGGFIQLATQAGVQTLVVNGRSGTNAAFSGVVTFAPAVPEPGVWLLMILGIGAVGGAMRYRRRKDVAVSANYNFA